MHSRDTRSILVDESVGDEIGRRRELRIEGIERVLRHDEGGKSMEKVGKGEDEIYTGEMRAGDDAHLGTLSAGEDGSSLYWAAWWARSPLSWLVRA